MLLRYIGEQGSQWARASMRLRIKGGDPGLSMFQSMLASSKQQEKPAGKQKSVSRQVKALPLLANEHASCV